LCGSPVQDPHTSVAADTLIIYKNYNIIYIENNERRKEKMDKELFIYNMVRLFRNKGYNDDQIADAMKEIIKEVEEKVNG